jgi:hypothetical protein
LYTVRYWSAAAAAPPPLFHVVNVVVVLLCCPPSLTLLLLLFCCCLLPPPSLLPPLSISNYSKTPAEIHKEMAEAKTAAGSGYQVLGPGDVFGEMAFFTEVPQLEVRERVGGGGGGERRVGGRG